MAEKLGPLGAAVKMLKPVIGMFRKQAGGKKTVKAKKGGEEGFLNQETGKFTPKQWTSAEREEYEKTRSSSGDGGGSVVMADLVMIVMMIALVLLLNRVEV